MRLNTTNSNAKSANDELLNHIAKDFAGMCGISQGFAGMTTPRIRSTPAPEPQKASWETKPRVEIKPPKNGKMCNF